MRKISFLALVAAFCITSCQKTQVSPSNDLVTANSEDQSVAVSNFALLTSHSWQYARYYTNYVDTTNFGTLVYKRGGSGNTLNLDLNRVTFYTDGSVDEIDQNGNHVLGTWYFTDSTQKTYVVTNSYGVFTTDILYLRFKRFIWTGPYSGTTGIMIPGQ